MSILLKNAKVVNEGTTKTKSLFIEDGIISKIIGEGEQFNTPEGTKIIDCTNTVVMPGVIDTHVHFREPGLTQKADIFSESRAAVAGGVTTYFEMPNTNPVTTSLEALENKINIASKTSLANFGFYVGATNNNADKISSIPSEKYCGIKIFMGSSTGNMLVDDDNALNNLFANAAKPIVVHCEDEKIIRDNTEDFKNKYGEDIPFECHSKIRSTEACYKSTKSAIELAKKYNTKLHIAHLTTQKETELLSNDNFNTKNITAEVCIQHMWFDENDYNKYKGLIKCNPSIKTKEDKASLMHALIDGKIDTIATDHAPHLLSEKEKNYLKCPSGIPLIQHSLQAILEFFKQGIVQLPLIVEKMCHNPAKLFNIEKRGYIREGYYADLVQIDFNEKFEAKTSSILHKCGWSPFENYEFNSKILRTFVNGNIVFENGEIHSDFTGKHIINKDIKQ